MSDRYGPHPGVVGDDLTIIGRALQDYLGHEIKRTVEEHKMFDDALADHPDDFTEEMRQNLANSKVSNWAWIAKIDDLRHRYIVDPVMSVETYREHFERMSRQRALR